MIPKSFIEFLPRQEAGEPFVLTDESAVSLQNRISDPTTFNFGGTKVHGVGWFMADHLPAGMDNERLIQEADALAKQVRCQNVASSIIYEYERRMESEAAL